MKQKTKALFLVLCLCVFALTLTACSDIKGIYDFFTDSDFGKAIDNLDELDAEDIQIIIENLDESDFKGLIDDLAGSDE